MEDIIIISMLQLWKQRQRSNNLFRATQLVCGLVGMQIQEI